ncbi:MFS transporter [Bacillus sp. BP-3]|uniref:MFS transporter n=1 Tax=Bacillus sp. BP-3 TaxID=3022773 RepID=UPI00232C9C88|nr:MFS transporter [Bacillus sp. BP-3]MDC2865802.1 MFS transporter [Bacillus sp. BP-3]
MVFIRKLFFSSSFFLFMGNWLGMTAINWYVYDLYHSATYLGWINFVRLIPIVLFSVYAGKLCDLYPRIKLMKSYSFWGLVVTTALAIYVVFITPSFSIFLLFSFVRGVISALETPNRNTILSDIDTNHQISKLISMNSFVMNVCRSTGPAVAGFLIAGGHIELTFMMQAICSLIAFILVLPMKDRTMKKRKEKKKASWEQIVQYFSNDHMGRNIFITSMITMAFGFSYTSVLPVLVSHQFTGKAEVFGIAMSAAAVGAIIATIILPRILEYISEIKIYYMSVSLFSSSIALLIISNTFMFFILLFSIGLFGQLLRSSNRVYFQNNVREEERGLMLSVVLMDRGMIPLGSIIVSYAIEYVGISETFVMMGILCMIPFVLQYIKVKKQNRKVKSFVHSK